MDAYIGATERSKNRTVITAWGPRHRGYGSRQKSHLRSRRQPTDCYPLDSIVTEFTLKDLNQAVLLNPRNAYQRYNAAAIFE